MATTAEPLERRAIIKTLTTLTGVEPEHKAVMHDAKVWREPQGGSKP